VFKTITSSSFETKKTIKINIKKQTSLNLLNVNALNAALSVPLRVTQKLISTNEVKPIISQPKKIMIKLLDVTKKIILIINKFKKIIKRSVSGS
jgi:hypothetical protein